MRISKENIWTKYSSYIVLGSILILFLSLLISAFQPIDIEAQNALHSVDFQKNKTILDDISAWGSAAKLYDVMNTFDSIDNLIYEENSTNLVKVQNNDITQNITLKKQLKTGSVVDFYIGNKIVLKPMVVKIQNPKEAWISIDNKIVNKYKIGDIIEISRPYYMKISNIEFDIVNPKESLIELEFFLDKVKSYSQVLIERDIGLHDYLASDYVNDTYVAYYKDVDVLVKEISNFAYLYPNKEKLTYVGNSRVYKLDDGVVWSTFLEGKRYLIHVKENMESVIKRYLDKWPSYLTDKTFCKKEIVFDIEGVKEVSLNSEWIEINAKAIFNNGFIRLSINGEEPVVLGIGETVLVNSFTVIFSEIDLTYENPKATLCVA